MKAKSKLSTDFKEIASFESEKNLRNFNVYLSLELAKVIGAIIGELDYAIDVEDTNLKNQSIGVALLASERALKLTKNLRYFAEQTRLSVEPVDISELVLDVSEWLEAKLKEKNIILKTLTESPVVSIVDENALRHVLLNLLGLVSIARESGEIFFSLKKQTSSIEIKIKYKGKRLYPMYSEIDIFNMSPHHDFPDQISLMVCNTIIESHGGLISSKKENEEEVIVIELPFDGKSREVNKFYPKRRFKRVKVDLPVELELVGYPLVKTSLCTLSERGAFIIFPQLKNYDFPKINDTGRLTICYFENYTVGVNKLRVASAYQFGPIPGIGVEFTELSPKSKKIIASIVSGYFP